MPEAAIRPWKASAPAEERDYPHYDVIESDRPVAHLSGRYKLDEWGAWYTLCGTVVTGWRAANLADTDHDRFCRCCERKAYARTYKKGGR
jgi:hypothetical protein